MVKEMENQYPVSSIYKEGFLFSSLLMKMDWLCKAVKDPKELLPLRIDKHISQKLKWLYEKSI